MCEKATSHISNEIFLKICNPKQVTFIDGDTYEGKIIDGKLNGLGSIAFMNGDTHQGNFKDGLLDGQGKIIYESGNIYEGFYKNGKLGMNDHVKVTFSNKRVYMGQLKLISSFK